MNEKKRLFRTPWREVFLLFMQRLQGIDLRLCSSTQWIASFRKRLENFSLNSMVQRIESQRLLYYYRIVLPSPIDRQNPLRSKAYRKNDSIPSSFSSFIFRPYLAMIMRGSPLIKGYKAMTEGFLKGVKTNRIRNYPYVVFQKRSTILQDGLKLATHSYLPAIIQRQEIFDRLHRNTLCTIPLRMQDKPGPLKQIFWQRGGNITAGQDSDQFRRSDKTLFIKQLYREVGIDENNYERRHMEWMDGVSFTRAQRMSMVPLDTIRLIRPYQSIRPYQVSALKSAYGNFQNQGLGLKSVYGDEQNQGSSLKSAYGDMEHIKADTIIMKNRISSFKRFSPRIALKNFHLKYKGKFIKWMEGVSSIGQMSMVTQDTIRSIRPYRSIRSYQGSDSKSAYGDMQDQGSALKSAYGDMLYTKGDTIIMKNRASNPERFSSNMDSIKGDWKREYFKGLENLNSPDAPGIIRSLNQDGLLKRINKKHLSDVALRQDKVDYAQADILYAIQPRIKVKTRRDEAYLDSISNETHEYPKPVSLGVERMPFNEMTQKKSPIWGKKGMGDKGVSVDYKKVADHVYEILTRRIIREKERMGELI